MRLDDDATFSGGNASTEIDGEKPRGPSVVRRSRPAGRPTSSERTPEVGALGPAAYLAPTVSGSRGAGLLRLTGLFAITGTIAVIVADFLPYARLDGVQVTAGQDAWSILAHLVLLLVGGGAGVLALTGRGGRVGPALIGALATTALGRILQHVYAVTDRVSHDGAEYYFGHVQTTASMQGLSGHTLLIVGWALLLTAGVSAALAWSDIAERDLVPLSSGRVVAGGSAGIAALLILVAMLVPEALTRIAKYQDATGLTLSVDYQQPHSMFSVAALGLVGGILLAVGWVLAAALVGAMSTRATVVAALVGLGGLALYDALLNARDVTEGPDIVTGPRLYLLLAAALVALGTAWYAATCDDGEPGG